VSENPVFRVLHIAISFKLRPRVCKSCKSVTAPSQGGIIYNNIIDDAHIYEFICVCMYVCMCVCTTAVAVRDREDEIMHSGVLYDGDDNNNIILLLGTYGNNNNVGR